MAPVVGTGDRSLIDIILHTGGIGVLVCTKFLPWTSAWTAAQEISYFIILMTRFYSSVYMNQDQ